jgi:hypothetical protein
MCVCRSEVRTPCCGRDACHLAAGLDPHLARSLREQCSWCSRSTQGWDWTPKELQEIEAAGKNSTIPDLMTPPGRFVLLWIVRALGVLAREIRELREQTSEYTEWGTKVSPPPEGKVPGEKI